MEPNQPKARRFRFRLGTLLLVIAILALIMVVYIQWMQLERSRAREEALLYEAVTSRRAAVDALDQAEAALLQVQAASAKTGAVTANRPSGAATPSAEGQTTKEEDAPR